MAGQPGAGQYNLPPGVTLATPGKRLGAYLLRLVLFIVTLGIGYLLWNLIYCYPRSQEPAKQLLKMKVVKKDTGLRANYGTMMLRNWVGGYLLFGVISSVCFIAGIVLDFMLLWDADRQQLWDKIGGTIVVDDPNDVLSKDTPAG
jgi:uncharacterized RDD family membrane protein YckC